MDEKPGGYDPRPDATAPEEEAEKPLARRSWLKDRLALLLAGLIVAAIAIPWGHYQLERLAKRIAAWKRLLGIKP
jgi:hypothetical protein